MAENGTKRPSSRLAHVYAWSVAIGTGIAGNWATPIATALIGLLLAALARSSVQAMIVLTTIGLAYALLLRTCLPRLSRRRLVTVIIVFAASFSFLGWKTLSLVFSTGRSAGSRLIDGGHMVAFSSFIASSARGEAKADDLHDTLQRFVIVVGSTPSRFSTLRAEIHLADTTDSFLHIPSMSHQVGWNSEVLRRRLYLHPDLAQQQRGPGCAGTAFLQGGEWVVENSATAPPETFVHFADGADHLLAPNLSLISVLIARRDGSKMGTLTLASTEPYFFRWNDGETIALVKSLASIVAPYLEACEKLK